MNIEHVALYVRDLQKARDFFCSYFEATSNDSYHNPKTGFRSYFLTFTDGARLELMNKPGLEDAPENRWGYAHIAFSVGSKEAVDTLTQRLVQDGYVCKSDPRTTGDGYYESLIVDLEGNQIEITI